MTVWDPNWGNPSSSPPWYGGQSPLYGSYSYPHLGGTLGTIEAANAQCLARALIISQAMSAELSLAGFMVFPNYGNQPSLMFWDKDSSEWLSLSTTLTNRWIDPHPYETSLSDEDKTSIIALLQELIKIKERRRAENSPRQG